jgi:hypothetical protein
VADEPIATAGKVPPLGRWMIVAIVALAAVGITALVTRGPTRSSATTTTMVTAGTTATVPRTATAVPDATAPPTSATVPAPVATATVDRITAGVHGSVVWQTGDPLGSDPGPYYCCFPPPPGSPIGSDYSDSRGCSGGADQSGNLVGGYWLNGRDC